MKLGRKSMKHRSAADGTFAENPAAAEQDNSAEENPAEKTAAAEQDISADETSAEKTAAVEQYGAAEENPAEKHEKESRKRRAGRIAKALLTRYFITAFSGMATGLFVTLIAGTIVEQIGKIFTPGPVRDFFATVGGFAKVLTGAGIGLGIAHALKSPKLVLAGAAVAGLLGAFGSGFAGGLQFLSASAAAGRPGDPISAYLASVVAVELGLLVGGKTKVDILVVPLVMLLSGGLVALGMGKHVATFMGWIGDGIAAATKAQPFLMGIAVSASMGLLLTLPTSSAAIGVSIGLSGISAGAAVAGCSAHMIGFAIASFRENRWGGLVAQGLGTSMLQIPNLGRNARILLPAVAASIVAGPLASCAFGLVATKVGSGMGTAGLVGIIDMVTASLEVLPVWKVVVGTLVCDFLVPAAVAFGVSELLRKVGWIRYGDMKIDV